MCLFVLPLREGPEGQAAAPVLRRNAQLHNELTKKVRLSERRVERGAGCQVFISGWGCYRTCILLPEFLKVKNRPVSCQLLSKLLTTSHTACSKGHCSPGSNIKVQGVVFKGFVLLRILLYIYICIYCNWSKH